MSIDTRTPESSIIRITVTGLAYRRFQVARSASPIKSRECHDKLGPSCRSLVAYGPAGK